MLKGGAGSAKRNPGTAGQGTRDGRRQGVGNASSTALLCATQVRWGRIKVGHWLPGAALRRR